MDDTTQNHGATLASLHSKPLSERFPSLRRLVSGRRRQIPYIPQTGSTDCGAASLAMALSYLGREIRTEEIRRKVGVGRDGLNARTLVDAARMFGLRARGVQLECEAVEQLPRGSILHWEFNHFLVFDRRTKQGVEVVDPAMGRRLISHAQFSRGFTGVALVMEPDESFASARLPRHRVWGYVGQMFSQGQVLSRVVVMSVLLRLFALGLPMLTALLVDRVVPHGDKHLLTVVGLGLVAALGFQLVSNLVRAHLLLQLRTQMDTRITLGFLDHLVALPYSFFQTRSAGDLMMRVNSNATIREILTSNSLSALLDGGLALVYVGLLFFLHAQIGAIVVVLGAVQLLLFLVSRRPYRNLMCQDLEAQARSQGMLAQIVGGIETLKIAGAERDAVQQWSDLFVDELNMALARGRLAALVDSVQSVLQMGSPLIVLSAGAILVMNGELSLGTMLAINSLAAGFLAPLGSLVASALQLQLLGSYVDRLDDVLSTAPEQDDAKVSPAPRLDGAISVRDLSFRYSPDSPEVVRDVSFDVAPGQCIALVGRSGSGKSTLASLLLGLHPPTSGNICFDGRSLNALDIRAVRRQIGSVPQHPYVFGSSIRSNIAMGNNEIPLDRIQSAAKRACIHDDIIRMQMGYDTVVADAGASLSGGQRQRIALARALLHKPTILVMDEATSALDTTTEQAVMAQLDATDCTLILVAHRLSTITQADEIIVMDEGRIVERGRHRELLEQQGAYAQLVSSQLHTGGYRQVSDA